jgi:putative methyltransferase (TIGR04325 family)
VDKFKTTLKSLIGMARRTWDEHFGAIRFTGPYESWESAALASGGYSNPEIIGRVLAAARRVRDKKAAYERDSILFDEPEYRWPILAALALASEEERLRLEVLDIGGSLGSTYYQHISFLKHFEFVRWAIVEQPELVRYGKAEFEDGELYFYNSVHESLLHEKPRIAICSASLNYIREAYLILEQLRDSNIEFLILDRTGFSDEADDIYFRQKVDKRIYPACYPIRIFSKPKLIVMLQASWELLSEIRSDREEFKVGNCLINFSGLLFRRKR